MEKYDLNLKTVDLLKNKSNFKSFYSGGPNKQYNQLSIFVIYFSFVNYNNKLKKDRYIRTG